MNKIHQAYIALGLEPGTSLEEVLKQHMYLASRCHPDKSVTDKDRLRDNEQMKKINGARDTIRKHLESGGHKTSGPCDCRVHTDTSGSSTSDIHHAGAAYAQPDSWNNNANTTHTSKSDKVHSKQDRNIPAEVTVAIGALLAVGSIILLFVHVLSLGISAVDCCLKQVANSAINAVTKMTTAPPPTSSPEVVTTSQPAPSSSETGSTHAPRMSAEEPDRDVLPLSITVVDSRKHLTYKFDRAVLRTTIASTKNRIKQTAMADSAYLVVFFRVWGEQLESVLTTGDIESLFQLTTDDGTKLVPDWGATAALSAGEMDADSAGMPTGSMHAHAVAFEIPLSQLKQRPTLWIRDGTEFANRIPLWQEETPRTLRGRAGPESPEHHPGSITLNQSNSAPDAEQNSLKSSSNPAVTSPTPLPPPSPTPQTQLVPYEASSSSAPATQATGPEAPPSTPTDTTTPER